ncbi:MAG: HipA domain-containing protein [Bacteroidales bacterium]|nr:HipA domain-containing protein [Bacteroidales bacterium]
MKTTNLFDKKTVETSTNISYEPTTFADNASRVSISGAQEKLFALVDGTKLRLANSGEQSTHIVKPIPSNMGLTNRRDMPANEFLTMQIAQQVFGIKTAACSVIYLANGEIAYIVRRFDMMGENKLSQEDFCSLLNKTAFTHGSDFKYQGSYLEIANALRTTVALWRIDMEQFVRVVIFNYLMANGDAHLKNFSVLQNGNEYRLTPAYDLLNTSLHIKDSDFALSGELGLSDEEKSDAYYRTGHPTIADFRTFALHCGLTERQTEQALEPFTKEQPQVETLCNASLLSEKSKRIFLRSYHERMARFTREK